MTQATYREIESHITYHRAFQGSSVRAEVNPNPRDVSQGQLNDAEFAKLIADALDGQVLYLVYSYATPIAWVLAGSRGMHITDQFFSRTTSRIQQLCRRLA